MKLSAANIERQVFDDGGVHRRSIHGVVPGHKRPKGLRIGVDFDEAQRPGRDLPLFIGSADRRAGVEQGNERLTHGVIHAEAADLFIGNPKAQIEIILLL